MITVKDARQRAKDALSKRMASLAASTAEAEAYEFRLALKVPTERAVLDDIESAETWARDWAHVAPTLPRNATLAWADRRWSRVGRQRIPTVLELHGAEEVARFVGGQTKHDWLTLQERCSALLRLAQEQSGSATDDGQVRAALKRHSSYLMQASDGDFATLLQVCDWLVINPDSGLRPRQLPIRGVDTKWLGTHRGIVTSFVTACTARPGLGLTESTHTIRMRILDPELHPSGPLDFAATEGTIQALGLKPQVVFLFENLESVLAMPTWPGAVVLHGSGYAVDSVARISWIHDAPIVYWGDLDEAGFGILNRLRSHASEVHTVLMDEETLVGHRDLWGSDSSTQGSRFPRIMISEEAALRRLRAEGNVRLEQERIPWATALLALQQKARAVRSQQLS